jgi:hypothetical protein
MSTGSVVVSDTGLRIAFQDAAATSLFQVVAPSMRFPTKLDHPTRRIKIVLVLVLEKWG